MFHPVGHQSPSVYWRRRLVLLALVALLILLIALTVNSLSGSGSTPVGAGSSSATPSTAAHRTSSVPQSSTAPHSSSTPKSSGKSSSGKSSPSRSSSAPPAKCATSALSVQAVAAKSTYQVGDQPTVEMQVTNTGAKPCVQDLADKQVELKVYNGESRVWDSHDCQVKPGTILRTLAVDQPVRVTVRWSGFSSQPGCKGTRQRVGAGTYTLYAALAGHTGKATQFSIG